jgi:hypothetical protein
MVTVRRVSRENSDPARNGAAQARQKLARSGFSSPQSRQMRMSWECHVLVPQAGDRGMSKKPDRPYRTRPV